MLWPAGAEELRRNAEAGASTKFPSALRPVFIMRACLVHLPKSCRARGRSPSSRQRKWAGFFTEINEIVVSFPTNPGSAGPACLLAQFELLGDRLVTARIGRV